jgi:Domain of unknown function (DUF5666)
VDIIEEKITMRAYQLPGRIASFLLLALLAALVAGCNLPFSSNTSNSSTSATACPTAVPTQVLNGTIQSINGTTLLISPTNGNPVKATYTSTTRFRREEKATTADLTSGTFVFVAVIQNPDNSYTASRISLLTGVTPGSRFGRGGAFGGGYGQRGNSACRQSQRNNNANFGIAPNERGLAGTISHLSGNILTVTDTNQSAFTFTVNSSTQIIRTTQITASSLQPGTRVTLLGTRNAQGVVVARTITVLM